MTAPPGGELVDMSGATVLVAVTQEIPLDCLSLVASRACIHEFPGTVKKCLSWERQFLAANHPPVHSTEKRLKHNPRGPYACLRQLLPGES